MPVSRAHIGAALLGWLLLAGAAFAISPQSPSPATASKPRNTAPAAASGADPARLFQSGEMALKQNRLDEAERDFRQIISTHPQVAGAYANLGVVYMRRKQWAHALEMLNKAEHLMPEVPGIRLNIGLTYYRQNEFLKAIPPLSR
jgi:Flp pilus assembly protein TadD